MKLLLSKISILGPTKIFRLEKVLVIVLQVHGNHANMYRPIQLLEGESLVCDQT